jgi:hypothetical protein
MASPELDGRWRVIRTGGLLPPFLGLVHKRIEGASGRTIAVGVSVPFDVVGLELCYRAPFRGVVDRLEPDGPDAYSGTTLVSGRRIGTFRIERVP